MTRAFLAVLLPICLFGCVESPPPSPPPTGASPRPPARTMALWHEVNGSKQLALSSQELEKIVADASREALQSMADARLRWQMARANDRARWAVLWAAPTLDGGLEYLWVLPEIWSEFRMEGTLASPPQHELMSGRELAERVSFPSDEIADWAVFADDEFRSIVEGGFTLRAVEAHSGT